MEETDYSETTGNFYAALSPIVSAARAKNPQFPSHIQRLKNGMKSIVMNSAQESNY
jgi:hypothetical protein